MARVVVPSTTLVGRKLLALASSVIYSQQECERLLNIVNQITNDGAARANLESSAESSMPVGSGNGIYVGLTNIKTALDSLAGTLSSIDKGER
ncbi:MAG: hypothetical protein IPO08_23600 [Xanthomonadales bacterium]|nr:hypothetical protein [Xanthomonadales bacterium]